MSKVLLSLGHGFSAQALAPKLLAKGWKIYGTTRKHEKAERLRSEGIEPIIWPDQNLLPFLEQATHLLTSIAPSEQGDPVLQEYSEDLKRARFDWVGYLSTTGVYGDHAGGWVDEETPLNPSTSRGRYRVEAENAWRALGLHLHIFRLAGIYGPGRGPFSKVKAGTARRIIKPNQVFSRIHADDIAQTVWASMNNPRPGAIYNVCDDDPAPPQDVIEYAANLLSLPVPPDEDFETAEMRPMARSFYSESKRVCNDLIKSELGVELKFPSYKDGLQALLNDQIN